MRVAWKVVVTSFKLVVVTVAALLAAGLFDEVARDFFDIESPFAALIPSFHPPRRWGGFVRGDLRNFVTANEAHFADHHWYGTYDEVVAEGLFTPNSGVTIVSTDGHDGGFSAIGTHQNWPGGICAIYVGTVRPSVTVTKNQVEGEIACTPEGEEHRRKVALGLVWLGAMVASTMVLEGALMAGTGFVLGLFLGPVGLLAAIALRWRAMRIHTR